MEIYLGSDDDAGCCHRGIGLTDRLDQIVAAGGDIPQVDDQDLIFTVMNDFGQLCFESQQIRRREMAFKDAVLEMVTPVAQAFEGVPQPTRVADVVSDQVDAAHEGLPSNASEFSRRDLHADERSGSGHPARRQPTPGGVKDLNLRFNNQLEKERQ